MLVFLNGDSHPIGSIAGGLVGLVIIGFVILMLLPDTNNVVGVGNQRDVSWVGCLWLLLVLAAIVTVIAMFLIAS